MIRIRGRAPVYFGIETDLQDLAWWTRAWLVEDSEPFRVSTWGRRLRLGPVAVHFGLCHYGEDPHRRMPLLPTEIGRWGVQEETATTATSEPAGLDEPGGDLDDAGDSPRGVDHPVS